MALSHNDYVVGWICALTTEYVAACELLDTEHPQLPQKSKDNNSYTLGQIGPHNVVIACLPEGSYGTNLAASHAQDMLRSFESIRIGLMVGIGGGAPSKKNDIRLGDVIVSISSGQAGGVIQYDCGKSIQSKKFELKGSLPPPPSALLTALSTLRTNHKRKGHSIVDTTSAMVKKNPRLRREYSYPGAENDRLYEAEYVHKDDELSCDECCDATVPPIIRRPDREPDGDRIVVHYGLIASANQLMKDALLRDKLIREHKMLCFEMEAAGLMTNFPCLVIRGISDYSDSHKNDLWQGYAAATAAAFTKELLNTIPPTQLDETPRIMEAMQNSTY